MLLDPMLGQIQPSDVPSPDQFVTGGVTKKKPAQDDDPVLAGAIPLSDESPKAPSQEKNADKKEEVDPVIAGAIPIEHPKKEEDFNPEDFGAVPLNDKGEPTIRFVNENGRDWQEGDREKFKVPTQSAFHEEEGNKSILDMVTGIPKGLMHVRDSINKAGQDMMDAKYPAAAIIRNKIAENFPATKGAFEGFTGYNLSETPEQILAKKIKPLSVVEGVAQLPEMVTDVSSGALNIANRTINRASDAIHGSDEGKDFNNNLRYEHHVQGLIHAQRREKGESILGDTARAVASGAEDVGLDGVAKALGVSGDFLDKNIDQSQANLWGMVVDPSFLVSGPVKAVRTLVRAGKIAEAEKLLKAYETSKLVKAAAGEIPPVLAAEKTIAPVVEATAAEKAAQVATPPPLPPTTAEEALVQGAEEGSKLKTTPAEVEVKPIGPEVPVKAPEGAVPPVLDDIEKAKAVTPNVPFEEAMSEAVNKAAEKTGQLVKGIVGPPLRYGKMALQSPSTAAVVAAGKVLDGTATGAKKIMEIIERNPLKSGFFIGFGTSALNDGDLADNIKYGLLGSIGGAAAERTAGKLAKFSEKAAVTGRALEGLGVSMQMSGTPTRALNKAAKMYGEGSQEQKLLKLAAGGSGIAEDLGSEVSLSDKIAAKILRAGTFVGPEIADPAIRGALIGGGLAGVASGGDYESIGEGIGTGMALGPLGHATGKMISPESGKLPSQNAYISLRLAELPEATRTKLMDAMVTGKKDPQSVAHLLEIHDLINPQDGAIEFLNNDEFISEIKKKRPNYNEETTPAPRGFFVIEEPKKDASGKTIEDNGRKRILVNLDSFDSSTLPHEAFHLLQGLGRYKKFSREGRGVGDDELAAYRDSYFSALAGDAENKGGKYTSEDLQRFHDQYNDLMNVKAPFFGPIERAQILSELWADSGGQFMERALLHSDGEGVLEYAKRIHEMSDEQVQALIDSAPPAPTGKRQLGDSALFKDKTGKAIRNDVKMERAMADTILSLELGEGRSGPAEGATGKLKVDEAELVQQVDQAVTDKKEASYKNDVEAIDAANKKLIDMAKLGIYKTQAKSPAQIYAEAKERAERVYGKGNVTDHEIKLSLPLIPEENIMSTRNLPMMPGDRPSLLTNSDRRKINQNLMDNIFVALKGKSAPTEGEGLHEITAADGQSSYVGSHMTPEQLSAVLSVDPKTLPKGLRNLIETLNDAMKSRSGQLFNGVYFEGIEKKGNVQKSSRVFAPTSWRISKAGNILVTAFDVGRFDKSLRELAANNPDSPLLAPFIEEGDTSPQQALKRFQDAVVQYNANHADGVAGATNLDPDAKRAVAKRNAINGFFGIAKSDVNPLATNNNFYRAFRLDRLYELEGANGAPFTIPYNQRGERLQEMNFQPQSPKPSAPRAEDIQALQLDEDSLSARVAHYNSVEKEGPRSIFDYHSNQRRVETSEEFQQRLSAESGFKTQEEADQAARQALDLRAQIRDLRGGSDGGSENSTPSPSPVLPSGNFQPAAPVPKESGPVFYSQLEKSIEDIQQEKMTIGQLRASLAKSGVKADELKWSGFDDLLSRPSDEKITRSEALKIAQENKIEIKEVMKSGEDTKYDDRQTPGGTDYRELLFTVPDVGARKFYFKILDENGDWVKSLVASTPEEAITKAKSESFAKTRVPVSAVADGVYHGDSAGSFRSSHYDEPNIVAHVRFSTHETPKGEKVLLIDENQSDWHQKGRKEGYRDAELDKKKAALEDERDSLRKANADAFEKLKNVSEEGDSAAFDAANAEKKSISAKLDKVTSELENMQYSGVPDAPFKKSWHELVMKRMLRYAAENGYDKIAWTKGEQQADRYDLGKQVDEIKVFRDAGNPEVAIMFMRNGEEVHNSANIHEDKLADVVGKDLAEKIKVQKGDYVYKGQELKVGGEGMKGFYDKILPDFINKYAKKWGARTGELDLPVTKEADIMNGEEGESGSVKLHSVDVTPSMKESVMQGQSMFQPTGDAVVSPTGKKALFKEDMKNQMFFLQSHAESLGFKNVQEMYEREPAVYDKLTKEWRADHPRVNAEGVQMFQPTATDEIIYPTEAVVGKSKEWLKKALTNPDNQLVLADITRDISDLLRDHRQSIEKATGLKIQIGENFMNGYWDKDSNPTIPLIIKPEGIVDNSGHITDEAHDSIAKVGALVGKALHQDAMGYTHGVRNGNDINSLAVITKTPLSSDDMRRLGSYLDDKMGVGNHAIVQDSSGILRALNISLFTKDPISSKDFIGHIDQGVKELGGHKEPQFFEFENDGRLIEDKDYEKIISQNSLESEPQSSGTGAVEGAGESTGAEQGAEGPSGESSGQVPIQNKERGERPQSASESPLIQVDRNLSRDADRIYQSYQSQLNGGSFQPNADIGGKNSSGDRERLTSPEEKKISPKELVGKNYAVIMADLTGTHKQDDVQLKGGPYFPLLKENIDNGIAWANFTKPSAQRIIDDARNTVPKETLEKYDKGEISGPIYGRAIVVSMSQDAHKSNISAVTHIIKTIEDAASSGKIDKAGIKEADKQIKLLSGDKEAPTLESSAFDSWIQKIGFDKRSKIADELGLAKYEEHGFPSVRNTLNDLRQPELHGVNWGDGVVVLDVDITQKPQSFEELGLEPHPSYPIAIKGKVAGVLTKPISGNILFDKYLKSKKYDSLEDQGAKRSVQLGKHSIEFTDDMAKMTGPTDSFEQIKNPAQANAALNALEGKWKTSDTPVNKGGVGIADFSRAVRESSQASSLDKRSPAEVKDLVKKGEMKIYQLEDSQIFFGLKKRTDGGWDLTSVVNNDPAAKGVAGPAILIKAIQEGATNLDAFSVPTKKNPNGFLQDLYREFGFKTFETIDFDKRFYLGDNRQQWELNDLQAGWKKIGWNGKDPVKVVSMKLDLPNEKRSNYLKHYLEAPEGELARTLHEAKDRADEGIQSDRDSSGGGGRDQGADSGSDRGTEGRVQSHMGGSNIRTSFKSLIKEVLSLDSNDAKNLGISPSRISDLKKTLSGIGEGLKGEKGVSDSGGSTPKEGAQGNTKTRKSALSSFKMKRGSLSSE